MSAPAALVWAAWAAVSAAPAPASALPSPPGEPRAHPRSILARVERPAVRLGVPFAYEVEIVHPADETVALAPVLDAPPFRGEGGTCRREPVAGAPAGGDVRTTCAIRLALFDLGPHDVPRVRLSVATPRGEATLPVDGVRVAGVGMADPAAPPDALALRPLAPPVPLLVATWAPALWALAAALALALALGVRRLRRGRARTAAAPSRPEPPDERLVRRLDALAARGATAREHFFELSAIVREWLGAITGVAALEMTTAELADRLGDGAEQRVNGPALVAFLELADLVKFGADDASAERCAAALAWARRLPAVAAARSAADAATPGRPA